MAGWANSLQQLLTLQQLRCQEITWHRSVCCSSKAVSACAKQVQWQEASSLLRWCSSTGWPCDEFSYNGLMAGLAGMVEQNAPDVWGSTLVILSEMMTSHLRPDLCSLSTALSALEKSLQWQMSLLFLTQKSGHLGLFQGHMGFTGLDCNFAINSALSSCKSTAWLEAIKMVVRLRASAWRPDLVSLHVVLGAVTGSRWQYALSTMSEWTSMTLQPGQTAWQMIASGTPKSHWRWPLQSLQHMRMAKLPAALTMYTTCIDASRWTAALGLMEQMQSMQLALDAACYRAAVGACEACGEHEVALSILLEQGVSHSPIDRSWALARLQTRDPWKIISTFREIDEVFRQNLPISSLTASEVAACWWSLASLGVAVPKVFGERLVQFSMQVTRSKCQLHELMLMAWGAAGASRVSTALDPTVLVKAIQQKAAQIEERRLCDGTTDIHLSQEFIQRILGIIWSSQQLQALQGVFYRKTQRLFSAYGKSLDMDLQINDGPATRLSQVTSNVAQETAPLVVYESGKHLVLYKPPGWEVHDGSPTQQLLGFLQQRFSSDFRIFNDRSCSHGFLHRLDVPSSGLILVAKSYESYYTLQLQLAAGLVLRDYVAICHGWLTGSRTTVNAPVSWQVSESSRPGQLSFCGVGKYAATHLTVQSVKWKPGESAVMTSLLIRIETGRRHQIRSHLAFIGHPLLCDGKYSSATTFLADLEMSDVNRNFLHRHHLAFQDRQASVESLEAEASEMQHVQDVYQPIPEDLQRFFRTCEDVSLGSALKKCA